MPPTNFVLNLGSCHPKMKKDKTTTKKTKPQTKQNSRKTCKTPNSPGGNIHPAMHGFHTSH